MPEVVIYAVEGRSAEQKRGLVKDITAAVAKNLGVPVETVVITIAETSKENKAKGGVLFSDMSAPPVAKAS
jgi:4-oxalocrotonate tautomerase